MQLLVDVALPVPLARAYTYAVPAALAEKIGPGDRVICPFGNRRMPGVVLTRREGEPPEGVKAIFARLDDDHVPPELLAFTRELASYYLAPIGEAVRMALPPLDRETADAVDEPTLFSKKRGVVEKTVTWVRAADAADACDAAESAKPAAAAELANQAEAAAQNGASTASAKASAAKDEKALRGQAPAILAFVRSVGEVSLAHLLSKWTNGRAAVKKLESLGLVTTEARVAIVEPFDAKVERDVPPALTDAQRDAADAIASAVAANEAKTFLLHGVTGSGKTEVYLRAIAAAKAAGRGSLVLVPEIALTPQLVSRFRARYGDDVAVLHSALTPKERLAMWRRLRRGEVDVAIGARSVLFAPVGKLGLIVVDEEHDSSFKQEEGVRYHARDMAILRAHRAGAVCVLGSATPALESEHLASTGRATKLRLPERARAQELPRVEIIDLRRIGAGPTGDKRLSIPLHRALEKTLEERGQAILFLNRRGFAPSVRCEACGEVASCPSCSVALTFHRPGTLRCHYCDRIEPFVQKCPKCAAPARALEGLGTEKLEDTISRAFPTARVARLDRDVGSGSKVADLLDRMRAREIDVLVGTQMVTKGHDLPHVTLVGVINADAALSIPDFRASERAFQLFVQVAGRAGRGDLPGRVLIQTYNPEHSSVSYAARHDVPGFLARELIDRRELLYPPFARLALVRVDAVEEADARDAARHLADVGRRFLHDLASRAREGHTGAPHDAGSVDVLGPAPAPLARLRNRFRYRVMLRSAERKLLRQVLVAIDAARATLPRSVRSGIDVDPVQLM